MPDENPDYDVIHELTTFLDGMEAHSPTRDSSERDVISYRQVELDEVIDDSLPEEYTSDLLSVAETTTETVPPVRTFETVSGVSVVAVDCGIVRLGETENGVVLALRATIVIDKPDNPQIHTFRTGPLYLHNHHKLEILYEMGKQLGKNDYFVELDESDPTNPRPSRVKSGIAQSTPHYADRIRNWFERLIQKIAVNQIENGVLLIDGALTLWTIDTPNIFFDRLAELANARGNAILALSKLSKLQVQGKPIRFWLNDYPNQPGYRSLISLMRREDTERVLGNTYAVRFSHLGPTFRLDAKPINGQTDEEAINSLFSSVLLRSGYPDILVRAHTYSYFTSPDVIQLQAQASAKYSLIPQPEVDLSAIFGPFGGRFK